MKSDSITSIMTKNVVYVSPQQNIIDVKHIYEKHNFHHHIPVIENGELIGIISLLDFMYNIAGAGINDDATVYNKLKVKDIMTQNPIYLTTKSTIENAAEMLSKGYFHAVPILENGKLVGIVTSTDLINFYLKK